MTNVNVNSSNEREVLQSFLAMHSEYHNHKENMAFSIFGLEGAFFIGLFVFSQWPPYLQRVDNHHLAFLFVAVWVLFHSALRFQLRNRRIAAILVASYYDALAQRADLQYSRGQFAVYPDLPLDAFIDACLLPVRGKLRAADVEAAKPEDGEVVRPQSVTAFYYHLAKHKAVASTSWTKYAYPIDFLTSLGSIFLLLVALARALGPSLLSAGT
jgi:hypothetical protein